MSKAGFSRKPRVYVPKCRKGDANPPTFQIRRLSPLELLDISERFSSEDETIEIPVSSPTSENKTEGPAEQVAVEAGDKGGKKVKISFKAINRLVKNKYAIVELALSGWENVEDEEGQPIPFNKENIQCLDNDIITELSEAAQGVITEAEAKN